MLVAVLSAGPPALVRPPFQAVHPVSPLVGLTGPHDVRRAPRQQFGWPLPGSPTVVAPFQAPKFRYGPGHRGVDLAAVPGAPVLAAGGGTVVFTGTVAGRGVVAVDHPGGLRTTYEPVSATVTAGQRVAKGDRIGTVQPGHPGCAVTVCLHWGAFRNREQGGRDSGKEYLDPLQLIIAVRVRLLPVDDAPHLPVTPGTESPEPDGPIYPE